MSYKALTNLKNNFEIEFLKSCSYEKINEIMNQLNDKIKKLEAEIKQLQNKSSNNKYTDPQATPKSCPKDCKGSEDNFCPLPFSSCPLRT